MTPEQARRRCRMVGAAVQSAPTVDCRYAADVRRVWDRRRESNEGLALAVAVLGEDEAFEEFLAGARGVPPDVPVRQNRERRALRLRQEDYERLDAVPGATLEARILVLLAHWEGVDRRPLTSIATGAVTLEELDRIERYYLDRIEAGG